MTKYLFTGEVPMIFADLSFSDGTLRPLVAATHAEGTDWPAHDGDGSTVTLYPGDTLELGAPYGEHAYLQPLEQVAKPAKIADLKAALDEKGIAYPPKAKKTNLEALLADQLPVITEDGIQDPAEADNASGDTPSGDAADTASTSSTSTEE